MLDTPMCLTFAINILVARGTVTWRIPQLYKESYIYNNNYLWYGDNVMSDDWW